LATIVLTGMIVHVVEHAARGQKLSAGDAWKLTRPRVWRLLGLSLLTVLVPVVVIWLPIGILAVLAFLVSDVAGVVALFAGASRDAYQDQLTALAGAGALAQIAADLGPIRPVRVHERAAEYELRAVQQGTSYSFYVLFVVDTDGVWRLRVF